MISVVYACNDAYVRQTLISIVSVWKHDSNATVYLITDEISESNRDVIRKIENQYKKNIHLLNLWEILPELGLDDRDRHPHTIYAKLFLDKAIKDSKVLYLDSDVIVRKSLKELFQREMKHEAAAGVLMHYGARIKQNIQIDAGSPYICDGVVLLNLELWREKRLSEACVQHIKDCGGNPPMLSESTLNSVCKGYIGVLEPKYNLMPTMLMYKKEEIFKLYRADNYYEDESLLNEAVRRPVIIHYMNELYNRPWFEPSEHPYKDVYRDLEAEIFGGNQLLKQPLSRHTRMTVWLREHLPFEIFAMLYHLKNRL